MFGSSAPCQYKAMSATGLLKKASGFAALTGLLCATSTTAIVQIWDTTGDDSTAGAVKVLDSLTLVAGQAYPVPAKITQGIYVKLVSGTGAWTVFFD